MLIYFAQLTHIKDNINQNRRFPLACGFISSYISKKLKGKVRIEIFKNPEKFTNALKENKPDIVMLSNYMWNEKLACSFAKNIRNRYKDTLIIMGGPNLSLNQDNNIKFLKENIAIDKLVFHDGEIPSLEIVKDFCDHGNRDLIRSKSFLSTLSVHNGNEISGERLTEKIGHSQDSETRMGMKGTDDINEIPSPYLTGLFDKFFKDGEVPLIETNRGCPFKCSFCQQGESYFSKVRNFNIDRVCNEIEYIAKYIYENNVKIDTICIADPNFAMYKRDGIILDTMRKMQDKYDYPKNVICSTGKNRPRLIIENASKLTLGSILLRSAVQSMDAGTLEAINRSNIKLDAYKEIQAEMSEKGLESNADLMLGLPNESIDSHFDGIYKLIDTGVKEIACLQTIMLKGTTLEKHDYVKKHSIKTMKRVIPSCFGSYNILGEKEDIFEFDEIIISNSTLSFEDYLSCRRLHLIIMLYHNTRLLQPTYMYLDNIEIPRSTIIKSLYNSKNNNFNKIVDEFIDDTKLELFKEFSEIKNSNRSFSELTSNKIFRYLSLSLYLKKEVICQTLKEALVDSTSTSTVDNEINDIVNIFDLSVISPFNDLDKNVSYLPESKKLLEIFGDRISLNLSEKQSFMLSTLLEIFSSKAEIINRMAYHLKPGNLSRQLSSSKVKPLLGDSSEYVVQ